MATTEWARLGVWLCALGSSACGSVERNDNTSNDNTSDETTSASETTGTGGSASSASTTNSTLSTAAGGSSTTGGSSTSASGWPPPWAATPDEQAEAEQVFTTYEGCSVESACPMLQVVTDSAGESSYDNGALRCLLQAFASSQPGFYQHVDLSPSSATDTVMLVHPVQLVEALVRATDDAGASDYSLRRLCVLAPSDYFQDCLEQLADEDSKLAGTPSCAEPKNWFSMCMDATVPTTPCF